MRPTFLLLTALSLIAQAKPCPSVPLHGALAHRYRVLVASGGPLGRRAGSEMAAAPGETLAGTGASSDQPVQQAPDPKQKFPVLPAVVCTSAPMPSGAYLGEYMRLGGPNGPMGCPTTGPVPTGIGNGGVVTFQNGSITTNPDVWPGGALAAYQDGPNIDVDWQVEVGTFAPGFHYDKFLVTWSDASDSTYVPGQVDVPAKVDQPDWNDTHLRSQGSYSIPWGWNSPQVIDVQVEGCDDPTNDILKPDPFNSRCLQGWMPAARVRYNSNFNVVTPNYFLFIDFNQMHASPPATVEDSRAGLRARAAAAILQAACSKLSFSFYNAPYRNGLLAKMLYADYFDSDACPGRTINNRDEVIDSLRNQNLWGDENTGSSYDGIDLSSLGSAIADLCGPRWNGSFASCPPYRKGEYDVDLVAYAALLSKYGSVLPPDVYHHVLYDLLTKKGPPNSNDRQVNIAGINGSETENHILNITVGQYLTNQLMLADTQDNSYNNATNGMNTFMANFLHNLLINDFLEYNARPYQDYAITALQFLYSFAADANDAPQEGVSSHAVKLAAQMVLDYNAAKVAVSGDDGRRVSPYRRKAKYDQLSYDPNAHDLIGSDGDAQFPRMLYLAGTGIDQLTPYPTGPPAQGVGINNYSWQMVNAAFSSYRLPTLILDEMIERGGRYTFESFVHAGAEIYFRSPSFMISAGGQPAPTLYPYQADPATVAVFANLATGVIGGVVTAPISAAVAASIQIGDDDARGVAVPTTLVPAGVVRDRDQMLRFEGPSGQNSTNMCVSLNFACGQNLQVPDSYLRKGCYTTQAGKPPGTQWMFIDFSGSCSTMQPWGFYIAIWSMPGASPQPGSTFTRDGLFEVYEHPGYAHQFVDEPQAVLPGHTEEPPTSNPPAPDPALGTLTFPQFISAVLARNGSKTFTAGTNNGPNAYTTLLGNQIIFQLAPTSVNYSLPPQPLVTGNFLYTDAPGHIIIHNDRMGEELTLDDTNPAAPIRTLRTGLPRPIVDQTEKRLAPVPTPAPAPFPTKVPVLPAPIPAPTPIPTKVPELPAPIPVPAKIPVPPTPAPAPVEVRVLPAPTPVPAKVPVLPVSFNVIYLNPANLLTPNKIKGVLAWSQGKLSLEEGGKETFSATPADIKDIGMNTMLGVSAGSFHIQLNNGKSYDFWAASLSAADTKSIADSLKSAVH